MKRIHLPVRRAVRVFPMALVLSLVIATLAIADPIVVNLGPSGGQNAEATVSLSNQANDDTGVRIRNKGQQTGSISIERLPGPPASSTTVGSPYPTPFQMVDQTLVRINSTGIPAGDLRVQVRIEYGRTMLQRLGLRERTMHVMKLEPRRRTWFPAVFANGGGVPLRFLPGRSADFVEGHFGIDFRSRYAWVVNSTQSDYALAGAVPEPVAAGLVLVGMFALLGRRARGGPARQQA
jgi:hypothetical protein